MKSLFQFKIILLLFSSMLSYAQDSLNIQEHELLSLINEARTEPTAFLEKYQSQIKNNHQFIKVLEKNVPIRALKMHEGLCNAAQQRLNGNLNPKYKGSFCRESSGMQKGMKFNSIKIINKYATNVLDPDYTYVGFVINVSENKFGFAFYWARDCASKAIKKEYLFSGNIDSSDVNFKKINTARRADYMSEQEKLMIQEINFARCYPKVYADIVKFEISELSKKWGGISHDDFIALEELIDELNTMQPLSKLLPKECVYKAARSHGADQKRRGFTGHTGTNGSSPMKRIKRKCPDRLSGNENLVGGQKAVRMSVIQLLIDSGIPGRGHRYNMLNSAWTHVGCYYNGEIGSIEHNWVQNFARF